MGEDDPGHLRPLRASPRCLAPTRSTSCGSKQAAFEQLPSVSEVDSALLLIPDEQAEKRKIIATSRRSWPRSAIGRSSPVDLDRLTPALETLQRRFDVAAGEAPAGCPPSRELIRAADDIGACIKLRQTATARRPSPR